MEHAAPILQLPKDMQRLIFEHMLPLRVLARSQKVCTQWNNELLSSLKKLTVNDTRINGEIFATIISKLSPAQFKHIKFGAEAFIWDLTPLTTMTRLLSLDIHNSPSLSSSAFVRAISHLTSLTSIRISRSLISPRHALPAIVKHIPQLAELKLSYIGNEAETADLFHVAKLTSLSTLLLDCPKLSLDDTFMLAICSSLTKLESLHINNAVVSESLSALRQLKMMTTLIVPEGYFSGTTPSILPSDLQHLEAKFSTKSINTLVSRCNRLTYLSVSPGPAPQQLTDEAFVDITRLPCLETLHIGFEVSDEIFKTALHKLHSVKYLGLTYNNAVCVGVFDLRKSLPNLVHLSYTTDAEPNHAGPIQNMGEILFPIIKERIESLGLGDIEGLPNKVTGMLLDLDLNELNDAVKKPEVLFALVKEALEVLGNYVPLNVVAAPNKNRDEEIQNLKQIVMDATLKFLEEENDDLELQENILDLIFQTNDIAVLRATVKSVSNLRDLINTTLRQIRTKK